MVFLRIFLTESGGCDLCEFLEFKGCNARLGGSMDALVSESNLSMKEKRREWQTSGFSSSEVLVRGFLKGRCMNKLIITRKAYY